MEPFYMNMHPFPHQEQMHYRPRCYSGMEARPPMSYGCWPWGGNYGYVTPGACHGCSNHGYAPSYYSWGSPYSHPPPHHCHGNYPYFPVQYMPPPPYNVMEHPRYEYEKNVPADGECCQCPGHRKEQRNVRIEEEEPEKERKDGSTTPLQFRNMPYPIMWLPPDGKERAKMKDMDGSKDDSRDMKVLEDENTVKQQQPTSWKGWLPIAFNNVIPPKEVRDGEENHRDDNRKKNSQFPLFWIPCKPDDVEHEIHKAKDVDAKPSLESEKALDGDEKLCASKGNVGDHAASKVKDIPVKEVEQHVPEVQEKERDSSGTRRKSQSPPKSSKLPPVCLRVDPLPRKKANAKSRSPSPPGDNQKLEVKCNGSSKAHSSQNEEEVKEDKGTKTITVADESVSPSRDLNLETPSEIDVKPQDDDSMKQAEEKHDEIAQKPIEHDAVVKGQSEDAVRRDNEEPLMDGRVKTDDAKKCRELSEEEAAVIIQSAYRRFDVCRWEPIKKLKQIAGVREQIAGVKRQIQELGLSSDVQGRIKQKNIIAETIMSLLLKLDMIQGLHPSIREVRKSVVRELVGLQEQLDALVSERPENLPGQEPTMRCVHEDASNKSGVVMPYENGKEVDLKNQIEGGANSESPEVSDANMIEDEASAKTDMEAAEISVDEGVNSAVFGSSKDEDKKTSEVREHNESPISVLEQGSELSLQDDSKAATDHNVLQSELAEPSQGVLDDLCAVEDTNHSGLEEDSSNVGRSEQPEEALIGSPMAQESVCEISNKDNDPSREANQRLDLPFNGVELPTEEADSLTGDAISEPSKCTAKQLENHTAEMRNHSEASDESDKLNDGAAGSVTEEVSGHLLQECNMDETGHTNIYDAADMTEVERQAETKPVDGTNANSVVHYGGVPEESLPQTAEAIHLENEGEEVDATPEMEAVSKQDDPPIENMRESNRRLMEENERLRNMMEKLIKSGQEQMSAISSLSGRVKDMEKQLSRKRKLKVKQSKAQKAGGKTIGVSM